MKKIKVLFLASNPKDTPVLRLDEEIRAITQKIRLSNYRDSVELISAWAVRPDDLLQILNEHKPQVIHFSGHGNRLGEIILMQADGTSIAISSRAVDQLFGILKEDVRVVILNACYSRSLAKRITKHIDCAIGMSSEVEDRAAITFAAAFYRAIGFGRSIRESVEQGKVALLLEGFDQNQIVNLISKPGIDPTNIKLIEAPHQGQPEKASSTTRPSYTESRGSYGTDNDQARIAEEVQPPSPVDMTVPIVGISQEDLKESGVNHEFADENYLGIKRSLEPIDRAGIISLFKQGGPIDQHLGNSYRVRDGQVSMALAIHDAIEQEEHAIIEAGTGIGKTFAYLIPLICSGKKAIVSTANKALQDQLWEKDIPIIREVVGRSFTAAIVKGISNYVCYAKCVRSCNPDINYSTDSYLIHEDGFAAYPNFWELHDQVKQGRCKFLNPALASVLESITTKKTGDADLLRLSSEERNLFVAESFEACPSKRPLDCFYELAIQSADNADIVVMNHASLAHLMASGWKRISHRDVLIIDEAHDFERYFSTLLRHVLRIDSIPRLVENTNSLLSATRSYVASLQRPRFEIVDTSVDLLGKCVELNQSLFHMAAAATDGVDEFSWPFSHDASDIAKDISQILQEIAQKLSVQFNHLRGNKRPAKQELLAAYDSLLSHFGETVDLLNNLSRIDDTSYLKYCTIESSDDAQQVVLCQEPFEASGFLADSLWRSCRTVVALSATLTIKGQFGYFRKKHGTPSGGVRELVIDSPFEYGTHALLYTPFGIIPSFEEHETEYVQKLAYETERLIIASRGRAIVLCTSWKRAEQLYQMLSPRLAYDVFCQGRGSPSEIIEGFKASSRGAVLFATRSFWQGVDIPGEALSLVVIDKLPFSPKDDFLVNERCNNIRRQGGNPFMDYLLAEAILTLRQGVGRLIRTESDRGVIAILDSRINQANYAKRIIASLPSAKRTFHFEDVVAFFAH